ncbi:E3 ubiquitin-protein ligase RAD18 isoform X2 [Heterodontus francisci]|uniref:E3 ubiquitin-protein ligase RAD18 isoform X2 n=1 Tax=Heterodontus francisci TaxID=7792 RepID=UPI00355C7A75
MESGRMWQQENRERYLGPMDDLLRCGICFEYFNIAMMIPRCSHNYCSLCVRKFLAFKTQCPICCVPVTEPELRNNRILDELVKCFRSARELLLKCDLESPPTSPQAARTDVFDKNHSNGSKSRATMKQEMKFMDRFLSRSPSSTPTRTSGEQFIEKKCHEKQSVTSAKSIAAAPNSLAHLGKRGTDVTEQPSTSGLKEIVKVDCPVCGVAIPENNINRHLDSCLTQEDKKESLRSSVNKRKLLPKLVYNLLSDRDLRKKLKEYGLSTQGSKAQLIKRHQGFVQMYNSQCDSLNPRSAVEIAREIERNEKTQAELESKASESMKFTKDQSEEEIDEIHKEYRVKHQKEFQQLVAEVRNRWQTKGKKVTSDKDTEEQYLTITGEDIKECRHMDYSIQEVHQDEPQLSQSTGSLATTDTLKDEHCLSDVVAASPLSTARELSNLKTQKRKMRGLPKKRSSENKRTRK